MEADGHLHTSPVFVPPCRGKRNRLESPLPISTSAKKIKKYTSSASTTIAAASSPIYNDSIHSSNDILMCKPHSMSCESIHQIKREDPSPIIKPIHCHAVSPSLRTHHHSTHHHSTHHHSTHHHSTHHHSTHHHSTHHHSTHHHSTHQSPQSISPKPITLYSRLHNTSPTKHQNIKSNIHHPYTDKYDMKSSPLLIRGIHPTALAMKGFATFEEFYKGFSAARELIRQQTAFATRMRYRRFGRLSVVPKLKVEAGY